MTVVNSNLKTFKANSLYIHSVCIFIILKVQ